MRAACDPTDLLRVEAARKPHLRDLIDQLGSLSRDAIEGLSEPLWIRRALLSLKESNGLTHQDRVDELVRRAIEAEERAAALPPVTHEVRLWDGPSRFVGSCAHQNNHSWKIEIETGDTFAILGDSLVRFGDSTLRVDDGDLGPLIRDGRLIGYMTLDQYRGFHRALLARRHKIV